MNALAVVVTTAAVIFCTTNAIIINWSQRRGFSALLLLCYHQHDFHTALFNQPLHLQSNIFFCCLSPTKACSSKKIDPLFIIDWRTRLPLLLSFFLHSIFFFHSLPIFIWFIISQKQPKEEGRWEKKEQSHRLWLLVAGMQHSCHGVI